MFDESQYPKYLISYAETKEEQETDFHAIATRYTIQGVISNLSREIKHSVSILDFSRMQEKELDNFDGKVLSAITSFPLRNGCELFRKCAGDKYCEQCDWFHASCMAESKEKIQEKLSASLDKIPRFFSRVYKTKLPRVLDGFDRPILEYHCPMLGYRELLFPLYYKERLFGVLFAGVVRVQSEAEGCDDDKDFQMIRESFFERNNPNVLFGSFADSFSKKTRKRTTPEDIRDRILTSDDPPRREIDILSFRNETQRDDQYYFKDFHSMQEYHSFLEGVCDAVKKAEDILAQGYKEKQRKYFRDTMYEIRKSFFERMVDESPNQGDLKKNYDHLVSEANLSRSETFAVSEKIVRNFRFVKSVLVFGDDETVSANHSDQKKVQYSTSGVIPAYTCDFSSARYFQPTDFKQSVKDATILNLLSSDAPRENRILILCRSIAFLLEVRELDDQKEYYQMFSDAIGKELSQINSAVALYHSNLIRERHLLTLRMYRHEAAHISTRLQDMTQRYFSNNARYFLRQSEAKQSLVVNEVKNTIQLLSNMADNIGLVIGSISESSPMLMTRNRFDVIDLLFKWQTMFHYQLKDRHLEICVPRSGGADGSITAAPRGGEVVKAVLGDGEAFVEGDRSISINARLFELLIYNLLDNAVKYAYEGSQIYLIWRKLNRMHELSVTSYGPRMKNMDEGGTAYYELYARSGNPMIQGVQGDGIGLYAVRRISQLLGIEVDHVSTRIADYYLPYIPQYKEADLSGFPEHSRISDQELERHDTGRDQIVINRREETALEEVSEERLIAMINQPTYRTTFRVRIQSK